MRPSERMEKQQRNLPCRASPAECFRERPEFPSRPFHNFSTGRHLWPDPPHMQLPRIAERTRIMHSSNWLKTFACDVPQVVFLASDGRRCRLDAIAVGNREFREAIDNKGFARIYRVIRRVGRKSKGPAHWTIVSVLTTSLSEQGRLPERDERMWTEAVQSKLSRAVTQNCQTQGKLTKQELRNCRNRI